MKAKSTATKPAPETLAEKIAEMPSGLRPPSPLALESPPLILTGNNGEKVAVLPLAETITPAEPWVETTTLLLKKMVVSPTNPRKDFNAESHKELTASMVKHGFTLSAMLVRPIQETLRIEQIEHHWRLIVATSAGDIPLSVHATMELADSAMQARENCFEIVAGERRFRAANAAGIDRAPCIVRPLTDQQVLELQLVESFRDNLNPIEEAQHMQILLTMLDANGANVHTTASLSLVICKSIRHIEQRRQLCLLEGEARAAVVAGALPVRTAFLIARIPDEKLRERATKAILHPALHEAPLSYRRADELVQTEFMRDLRGAPFAQKDAELVPVCIENGIRIFGGDCISCPARLGNSADPGTITPAQHNLCLSPKCFAAKCERGWSKWAEENTDKALHRKALSKADCERIYKCGDQLDWNAGLVDLADRPDSNDLKPGKEETATWRKMIHGTDLEISVARDRNGRSHDLVSRELAIAAAQQNGHKNFKAGKNEAAPATLANGTSIPPATRESGEGSDSESGNDTDSGGESERLAMLLAELVETRRAQALMKGAKKATDAVVRAMIKTMLDVASDGIYDIADALGMPEPSAGNNWGEDPERWVPAAIEKMTDNERIGTLVLLCIYVYDTDRRTAEIAHWRKVLDVDFKPIDKAAKAEHAAKQKAAREEEELHAALSWDTPTASIDREFTFNGSNSCTDPMVCTIKLPSKKAFASVQVGRSNKGWHVGYHLHGETAADGGVSSPVLQINAAFSSRALALHSGLLEAYCFFKNGKHPAEIAPRLLAIIKLVEARNPAPAPKKAETKSSKSTIAAEIKSRWEKVRAKAAAKKPAKKAVKKGGK